MILNKETLARIFAGGGGQKPDKKSSRLEDKCSPSIEKGGVKLDSWQ